MNDIYEHKANKYKYKYLELKNRIEYIGGGGEWRHYVPFWNAYHYYKEKKEKERKKKERKKKEKEEEEMKNFIKQKYINSYNELIKKNPAIITQYQAEESRIKIKNNNALMPNGNGTTEDLLTKEKFLKTFCKEIKDHFHFIEYECKTKKEYDDEQKKINDEKQRIKDIITKERREREREKERRERERREKEREDGSDVYNPRLGEPLGIW
jgi:hypothetical protein